MVEGVRRKRQTPSEPLSPLGVAVRLARTDAVAPVRPSRRKQSRGARLPPPLFSLWQRYHLLPGCGLRREPGSPPELRSPTGCIAATTRVPPGPSRSATGAASRSEPVHSAERHRCPSAKWTFPDSETRVPERPDHWSWSGRRSGFPFRHVEKYALRGRMARPGGPNISRLTDSFRDCGTSARCESLRNPPFA